ncbi:MAG TPA: aminomethyl-transferring glycine dehydrogenase subunit GcvPB [Bacteroidota bacterium]
MSEPLLFEKTRPGRKGYSLPALDIPAEPDEALIPSKYGRKTPASLPELTENEVVRHFIRISTLNHHIDKGFYPLGSCTMKYNPKVNEAAAAFPGFRSIHPLEPAPLVQGALQIMDELSGYLKEIVGMEAVSLQPAAGAQGELSSLLMIRKYHEKQGRARKTILVPDSAHGTNPASVTMAGYQTVTIRSNNKGMVDLEDLRRHLNEDVAGLMLTNPNTLGIFEKQILEIQKQIHAVGALMYMDGANLNALLGITRPGDMGFDCVHMNLHKTFSTPHGGGGPGAGPIAVNRLLEPFLPVPRILKVGTRYVLDSDRADSIGKIHSFYGNFGMHVRAYTYIRMHGARGLREVGENAILNANYLLSRLKDHFELPYKETPMHEFVLSGERQRALGVRVTDIAKRLLDFGVHAPTIYFPLIVREALMIEPTETETKETLDAFAEALIQINEEVKTNPEIVLKAPHTTPVRRLDEARAARQVDVCFRD